MVFAFPFRMVQTLINMIHFLSLLLLTLSGSQQGISSDSRSCQTPGASPAEPGGSRTTDSSGIEMQNTEKLLSWATQAVASSTANQFDENNGGLAYDREVGDHGHRSP